MKSGLSLIHAWSGFSGLTIYLHLPTPHAHKITNEITKPLPKPKDNGSKDPAQRSEMVY